MIRRLFAFVILLGLAAGGLWYWKLEHGQTPPELGAVGEALGRRFDDAKLQASVKAAFELNRRLQSLPLHVQAEEGVVTLRGDVPDAHSKALAEQVARQVPGVRQVVDHLRVVAATGEARDTAGERTWGENIDDQALRAKVHLALSLRGDLAGAKLDVRVFRRAVTLSGEVRSEAQRAAALQLVSDVPDVREVVDKLRIAGSAETGRDPRDAAERALADNEHLAHYALEVRAERGRLVLRGRVTSAVEQDLAGRVAREAAGVPVDNALEILPARP